MENTILTNLTHCVKISKQPKKIKFGRKIFETFAARVYVRYPNEGTEVAKLNKVVEGLKTEIENKDKAHC